MEIYPSTPAPIRPISIKSEFKTLVTDFETGKEQRRQLWTFPKRTIALKYRTQQTNTETLWNFYGSRKGKYEPFYFVMPYAENHQNEYVTKGDGSAAIFDLPSISTDQSTLIVYINSIQTLVTFLSGGGQAGADRIQFNALGNINSSSVANPTVITTSAAHGLWTGNSILIAGHTGSAPDINGNHTVTVISSTTFSIPVNVTVAGTGGTWALNPPANGATITADFSGRLRFTVRFAEDKLSKEMFEYFLYSLGIGLKEVK